MSREHRESFLEEDATWAWQPNEMYTLDLDTF